MASSENDILRSICDYLAYKHYFFYRCNNIPVMNRDGSPRRMPPYAMAGVPDIVLIEPKTGRYWGLEVKTATGKVSDGQREFEARTIAQGGKYNVVRSITDVQALGL